MGNEGIALVIDGECVRFGKRDGRAPDGFGTPFGKPNRRALTHKDASNSEVTLTGNPEAVAIRVNEKKRNGFTENVWARPSRPRHPSRFDQQLSRHLS